MALKILGSVKSTLSGSHSAHETRELIILDYALAIFSNNGYVNVHEYLPEFIRQGRDPAKVNFAAYGLECHQHTFEKHDYLICPKYIDGGKDGEVVHDTNYSFVLLYQGEPTCLIGFDQDIENSLMIEQIQGINAGWKRLEPFEWWREMMITMICDWGRINNFKQVRVRPACQNEWAMVFAVDDGVKSYDIPAMNCGFELMGTLDKGYYYLDL